MGEYTDGVLIGNWREKLLLKQAIINNYLHKKQSNQLLTQKYNKVKENLLKPIQLSELNKDNKADSQLSDLNKDNNDDSQLSEVKKDHHIKAINKEQDLKEVNKDINDSEIKGITKIYGLNTMIKSINNIKLNNIIQDNINNNVICYGDFVQIINPAFEMVLSCVINLKDIYTIQDIGPQCLLVGSKNINPCVRNVFKIVKYNDHENITNTKEPLRYGQDFCLVLYTNSHPPSSLYISCSYASTSSYSSSPLSNNHPFIQLSSDKSTYCRWKVLSYNKYEREDYQDTILYNNTPIRIQHSNLNQQLALETNHSIQTLFHIEWQISAHTYFNTKKLETVQNAWIIRK